MPSIAEWIKSMFQKRTEESGKIVDVPFDDDDIAKLAARSGNVTKLAFWRCVNLVANAVGLCEFRTYQRNKEIKGDDYYRLNIMPNLNQGSSEFIHKWIAHLMYYGDALIVEVPSSTVSGEIVHQMLVADSYTVSEYALKEDVFSDITFNGRNTESITLDRVFYQSEVFYFKMPTIRRMAEGFSRIYEELLNYSLQTFMRSRGNHGILKIRGLSAKDADYQKALIEQFGKQFSKFYAKETSVMPLDDGVDYSELAQKTYSEESSRDTRALVDDIMELMAMAFGIPPELVNGKVDGMVEAMNKFLTFCIDPLCQMIQEEITAKLYGERNYRKGSFVTIDTSTIRHSDFLSYGDNLAKLQQSHCFTPNEIRRKLGEPPIDEPWADDYFSVSGTNNFDINPSSASEEGGNNE